ncbi:MAG TPA: ABC transporter permease [Anaerolineae bacterium]|nr:ABC transporter permease [Anaerolineae bacterium]
MRNFWLIAKRTYLDTVAKRQFIILTLAVPVGIVLLGFLGYLAETMNEDTRPVGYVDEAGILDPARHAAIPDAGDRIQVRSYPSVEAGREAVTRGEVTALFVFPPGYPEVPDTELYYQDTPPGSEAWSVMADLVRANLVAGLPADVQDRLLYEPNVVVHDVASGRTFDESAIITFFIPFIATFLFFFATMTAAGNMLGVVGTEKENRTIEVMLTTVTPSELIVGKMAGLLAASLTQIAVYVLAAVVGLRVAGTLLEGFEGVGVPWDYLGLMALYFFPAYILLAGIMVGLGAATTEVQQAQQVAGLLNLLFMVPIFAIVLLMEQPEHPITILLTLFPTTSFLTISMRWAMGNIPAWQLVTSWLILAASAVLAVWAAARVFRAGMLRYGQPLSLKSVVAAMRGAAG